MQNLTNLRFGQSEIVSLAPLNREPVSQDMDQAIRDATLAVDTINWLQPGDTVFIKPVINSGKPYPATTSPLALGSMIRLLREKGAGRVVVGDMSGVGHLAQRPEGYTGSTRKLAEKAGLLQAVLDAGAEWVFFEEAGWDNFYEEQPVPGSHWQRGIMLPNVLREVDHIVSMPRCSRHALLGNTLGLKSVVGYMRYDTRLEYHHAAKSIQEKTAEANTVPTLLQKQRLVVTAADKVLATLGPDLGYVFAPPQGLVIASCSTIAHDLISLAWLLIHWRKAPWLNKQALTDPSSSQFVSNMANRVVAGILGGWKWGISAQTMEHSPLPNIWRDRTLIRACELMGGVPDVQLRPTQSSISPQLIAELASMVTLPTATRAA
ncbi:MAG TPA: DUF362 domain-containing protein [Leptolyngbyaceae cyanobacterium M33_DOE_097]|uniref:DUF362 domain-containing protein n=1 Tax=Oscillatoriales cyanobacterium SpSt-418 TaxID=2282169 RepID=A0A7C3PKD2_9CYAN|nr:DUF362 domain-containing protein [Leptolyngbyaceae cyanobacterium M33_DOE_097]